MSKFFLQHDTTKIFPLGECDGFSEAIIKADDEQPLAAGPTWILDEESLRELQANIQEALNGHPAS